MKNLLALTITSALLISGCGTLVKYQFSSKEEQSAGNLANWIQIASTKDGNNVYYDPFQMIWSSSSVFVVPIRYATSGEYGNWIYRMDCYNDQITIVRTLGGRIINKSVTVNSDNILKIAKDKLCGINIGGQNYAYIGVDNGLKDYYYNTRSFEINSKNPSIYKAEIKVYSRQSKSFEQTGEIEVNCSDRTFRASSQSSWVTPEMKSPANVLIYQFCMTPSFRNSVTKTYVGNSKGQQNTDMQDYINKLDSTNKKNAQRTDTPSVKKPQIQNNGFEWNNLVIQPKN